MTIYIVKWSGVDTLEFKNHYATASYADAEKKYLSKARQCVTDADLDIDQRENAITKHTVSTQKEVINLINSL